MALAINYRVEFSDKSQVVLYHFQTSNYTFQEALEKAFMNYSRENPVQADIREVIITVESSS
jgi:hypothetical protein